MISSSPQKVDARNRNLIIELIGMYVLFVKFRPFFLNSEFENGILNS